MESRSEEEREDKLNRIVERMLGKQGRVIGLVKEGGMGER